MADQGLRLKGKVAIVTGAGSSGPGVGTGKAISVVFAREGASVILMDVSESQARETLSLIESEGGTAAVVAGDVTREADCKAAASAAVERYGKLDILVNNVGINRRANAIDIREEDWNKVIDTNLKGMVLMAKHSIPRMIEAGGGSIINISSVAAIRPSGPTLAYTAAKGGVQAITGGLAVEHGRQGIRANCIAPGNIYTPMIAGKTDEERRNFRRDANPLGLEGTAWDVAYAALFFASDEARWISGQVLAVDGAYTTAAIAWYEQQRKADASVLSAAKS